MAALPGIANFEFGRWQAWQGTAHVILSDSNGSYELQYFDNADNCVNWLFLNGHKDAARALNAQVKKC